MTQKKRILVCEDDPVQLAILTAVLGQAGYETTAARTPAEGVRRTLGVPVDAVLADVHLGQGNAFELHAGLRRAGRDVPVLMISGRVTRSLQERAVREGVRGVVEKPCDVPSIVRMVRGLVERPAPPLPVLLPRPEILGRADRPHRPSAPPPLRQVGILHDSPRAEKARPRAGFWMLAASLALAASALLIDILR